MTAIDKAYFVRAAEKERYAATWYEDQMEA